MTKAKKMNIAIIVLTICILLTAIGLLLFFKYSPYMNDANTFNVSASAEDNVVLKIKDDKIIISGSGKMKDFESSKDVPWKDFLYSVSSVDITGDITYIGKNTFCGAKHIKEINLNDGLLEIGELAFSETGINKIVIPSSVVKINMHAFSSCYKLTSVSIPISTTPKPYAFLSCPEIKNVTITPGDESSVKYSQVFEYTYPWCGVSDTSIIVAEGITEIKDNMFYQNASIKNILLPESIKRIGDNAFYNCTNISNISLPSKLESIGSSAFYKCSGLTTISIPASVKTLGAETFSSCHNLSSVVFAEGSQLESIGKMCFAYDESIKQINMPATILKIEDLAFSSCNGLESITFSEDSKLDYIGSSAFKGCSNLASFSFPKALKYGESILADCKSLKNISLNDFITEIPNFCFTDCSELETVIIPDSISKIGVSSFAKCTKLQNVKFPESLTEISDFAFMESGISKFVAPKSLQKIGMSAFKNCKNLSIVELNDDLKSLSTSVFSGCEKISKIEIPDSITEIPLGAFNDCAGLNYVYFGKNIKSVDYESFINDTNIKELHFDNNSEDVYLDKRIVEHNFALSNRTIFFTDTIVDIVTPDDDVQNTPVDIGSEI